MICKWGAIAPRRCNGAVQGQTFCTSRLLDRKVHRDVGLSSPSGAGGADCHADCVARGSQSRGPQNKHLESNTYVRMDHASRSGKVFRRTVHTRYWSQTARSRYPVSGTPLLTAMNADGTRTVLSGLARNARATRQVRARAWRASKARADLSTE